MSTPETQPLDEDQTQKLNALFGGGIAGIGDAAAAVTQAAAVGQGLLQSLQNLIGNAWSGQVGVRTTIHHEPNVGLVIDTVLFQVPAPVAPAPVTPVPTQPPTTQ